MVIIETSIFTKKIKTLLDDNEYRVLQNHLVKILNSGNIIQASGGIRKIRWAIKGGGKRGGMRIIYYWATSHDQIFMLYVYAKNEHHDLTKDQLSVLKKAVELELKYEE